MVQPHLSRPAVPRPGGDPVDLLIRLLEVLILVCLSDLLGGLPLLGGLGAGLGPGAVVLLPTLKTLIAPGRTSPREGGTGYSGSLTEVNDDVLL